MLSKTSWKGRIMQKHPTTDKKLLEYLVEFLMLYGVDRSLAIGMLQTLKTDNQRKMLLVILLNCAKENLTLTRGDLLEMTQEILKMSPTHPEK